MEFKPETLDLVFRHRCLESQGIKVLRQHGIPVRVLEGLGFRA